jgi:hypothetical protein
VKRLPLVAALVTLAIHLVANPHYGFFRDELYFVICGMHPQFGYVDQPPVVPLLSALTQLAGHSLVLLRAVPALFDAAGVYATCELVEEFGGGTFAQAFAAIVFFFTPVLASFGMKVGTDEVGLWTWPLLALLVVRLTRGASPRLWIAIGIVAGFGVESKYSIIFYFVALVAGLALTGERRIFFTPWFAGGAVVAFAIALPNLIWQWREGFPMWELLRNGQLEKNLIPSPALYAFQELLITNVLLAAVWSIGFVWLLRASRFRFFAFAYVVLIGEMLLFHGKHYYPANVYPILIAGGAVAIEAWMRPLRYARAARAVLVTYAVVAGLVFLPDALPVLSEPNYLAFAEHRNAVFHFSKTLLSTEHGREDEALPADWADMHGWPEMAAAVEAAYDALPTSERRRTVVFAGNYGEASAIAFFAPNVPVISEHNQYWLWGPRGYDGTAFVQINGTCFHDEGYFRSRRVLARLDDPYAIAYEAHAPIWLCSGLKKPLAAIWPKIKDYE